MSSVAKIPLLPQPTLQSLTDNLDLSPESLSSPAIEQLRLNVNIIQKTRATYNFTDLSLDSVPTFKLSLKKAVENSFREALEFAQEEEQNNQNEIEAVEVPQTKTNEMIKRINPRKLERKVSLVTEDKAQEHNVDLIYDGDRKVVIEILKVMPELRLDDEIKFLQKVLEHVKFFGEVKKVVPPKIYKKIFQKLKLEEREPGQKLFGQGNFGKKFYIILEGSMYLMLKRGVSGEEKKKEEIENKEIDSKTTERDREIQLQNEYREKLQIQKLEEQYPDRFVFDVLEQGESFGDVSRSKVKEKMRTATVVAREKTVLGVLDFGDYQAILGQFFQNKNNRRIDMLLKINIFAHWSYHKLLSFVQLLEEIKHPKNYVLFHEGDEPQHLYFVLKGEIELNKTIHQPCHKKEEYPDSLSPRNERKKAWQSPIPEKIRIALIPPGGYFGEGELVAQKPRGYTALVHSLEAQLLSIPREKFLHFVNDAESLKRLEAGTAHKTSLEESLLSNSININNIFSQRLQENISDEVDIKFQKHLNFRQKTPPIEQKVFPNEPQSVSISLFKRSKRLIRSATGKRPIGLKTPTAATSPKNNSKLDSSVKTRTVSPGQFINPTQSAILTKSNMFSSGIFASPTQNNSLLKSNLLSSPNTSGLFEKKSRTVLDNFLLVRSKSKDQKRNSTYKKTENKEKSSLQAYVDVELQNSLNFVKRTVSPAGPTGNTSGTMMSRISPEILRTEETYETQSVKLEEFQPMGENINKQQELKKILNIATRPMSTGFVSLRVRTIGTSPEPSSKARSPEYSANNTLFITQQGPVYNPYPSFSPGVMSPKRRESRNKAEMIPKTPKTPKIVIKDKVSVKPITAEFLRSNETPGLRAIRVGTENNLESQRKKVASRGSPRHFTINILAKQLRGPSYDEVNPWEPFEK